MKSKLALYSYDCETRVEIALPDTRNHRLSATGMDGIREDA